MKKFFTLILLFIILPSVYFSCSKEESDTNTPRITDVRLNIDDTIVYIKDSIIKDGKKIYIKDTIVINTGLDPNQIDTLAIGDSIYFYSTFHDEEALSSYKIRIEGTTRNLGGDVDTVFGLLKTGSEIFGKTDLSISKKYVGSIPKSYNSSKNKKDLPIREGDYFLHVYCADKRGNIDTLENIPIKLFTLETIIKTRRE